MVLDSTQLAEMRQYVAHLVERLPCKQYVVG